MTVSLPLRRHAAGPGPGEDGPVDDPLQVQGVSGARDAPGAGPLSAQHHPHAGGRCQTNHHRALAAPAGGHWNY